MTTTTERGVPQGQQLYEYLESLPSNRGVTLDELAAVVDTSPARIAQLLTRIRHGELRLPRRRGKENVYPPLNIQFDRLTERYYNMTSADAASVSTRAPGDILRTWLSDAAARLESAAQAYAGHVETAAQSPDPVAASALLEQMSSPTIIDLVERVNATAAAMDQTRRRAGRVQAERRRERRALA